MCSAQQMSLNSTPIKVVQSLSMCICDQATATTSSPPTQKIIQIFRIHPEEKTSTISKQNHHLLCATTLYIIILCCFKKTLFKRISFKQGFALRIVLLYILRITNTSFGSFCFYDEKSILFSRVSASLIILKILSSNM